MITRIDTTNSSFEWIDIIDPKEDDFADLKVKYNLNDRAIKDCLEVGRLPKIEEFENYYFLILRSVGNDILEDSDSLTEITQRLSIFYSENFVITVHRNEIEYLELLKQNKNIKSSKALVNSFISASLKTFEHFVVEDISVKLDEYEEVVFLQHKRKPFLKKLYYLKRQVDVTKYILILNKDIVDYFHLPEHKNMYTQNLKDILSRTNTLYRNTSDNISQLVSIYFNIESNHTNEIMRTLTIISVFFMPLTFIVGVYGMNFKHMPELEWYYGYPIILGGMLILSILIFLWFKKKDWL